MQQFYKDLRRYDEEEVICDWMTDINILFFP